MILQCYFLADDRLTQIFADKEWNFLSVAHCLKIDPRHAERKMCLMPRMGMTTQSGRLFSS